VISLGGIVVDTTIRIAGNDLDEAILSYAKTKYNILIGLKMAEDVKIAVGSAIPYKNESDIEIKGRDLITGLPRVLKLTSAEVREAMIPVLEKISEAIREAVEQTPPEILADLIDRGITLAGGGALIRNIDKFFEERLKTPIIIAEDPIKAVVNGTETLLDEIDLLERVKLSGEEIL
jgi:rod shape-determining protein MreB